MKTIDQLKELSGLWVHRYGVLIRLLMTVLVSTLCTSIQLKAQQATWSLNGNTVDASSFIGTLNLNDLKFKVNNKDVFKITSNGRLITFGSSSNMFMGNAGNEQLTGSFNIGLGLSALSSISNGERNTAIGNNALASITNSSGNVAVGANALYRSDGDDNVAIGLNALANSTKIIQSNVAIGLQAGSGIGGNNNVLIGAFAGENSVGSGNILIGALTKTVNNSGAQLNIGNWIYGDKGKIGINMNTPKYTLDVGGKANLADTLFGTRAKFINLERATALDSVVMVDNAGNLHKRNASVFLGNNIWGIAANNTKAKGVQFDGNVGIGTTNPAYKLDIVGKAKLTDTLFGTTARFINIQRASATDSVLMVDDLGNLHKRNASAFMGNNIWGITANNTKAKGAQFDGNVGIGTANPMYKLDVAGKANLTDTLFGTRAKFANLDRATATDSVVMVDNAGNLHKRNASAFVGNNIWGIAANNAKVKGAQFDGNVGIGTANPAFKLEVAGKAKLTDTLFGTKAKFSGLANGEAADNFVTVDNAGNLHKIVAANLNSWSVNSSQQLYTNFPLAIGTGKNGSHANAAQPGTVLTINGRTHIGKADGTDASWVNYDQSASVKDFLLYVQKGIITEDIGIATAGNSDWTWSDFVFDKNYRLRPLTEVEKYISAHKHLPEIPSTAEIAKRGYSLNKMNSLFLQKIEELTLYSIAQEKQLKIQGEKIRQLEEKMEKALHALEQSGVRN